MTEQEIAAYLIRNTEAVRDEPYGPYYRASAYLKDGTCLPCVMFGNPRGILELARSRFQSEAQNTQFEYVLRSFVIGKAVVPIEEVTRVEMSHYAWPAGVIDRIEGETTMGWTAFTVRMRDRSLFQYGSAFDFHFLDLPPGYTVDDIGEVYSGTLLNEQGEIEEYDLYKDKRDYLRERHYFYCYSDWLPE